MSSGGKKSDVSDKSGKSGKSDSDLWGKVADTIVPLSSKHQNVGVPPVPIKPKSAKIPKPAKVTKPQKSLNPEKATIPPPPPPPLPPQKQGFDPNILQKIKKGTKKIDAQIDLHGLKQDEAHTQILRFIERGQSQGHRLLLIVTGKGLHGEGVLHDNVPRWLSKPPFSQLISGFEIAHDRHGGKGALYVQPKRIR